VGYRTYNSIFFDLRSWRFLYFTCSFEERGFFLAFLGKRILDYYKHI